MKFRIDRAFWPDSSPLFTKALAIVWAFVPESGPVPYLHVSKDGVDLGRCVTGLTFYDGVGGMTFVADEIAKRGFE